MERKSETSARRSATLTDSEQPEAIGAYLRRQRCLRGISLAELHAKTQIPLRSLERLEAGVFDKKPDGFVRGLVRTVAGALGLDPSETVMRMLREAVVPEDATCIGAFVKQHILVLAAFILLLTVGFGVWLAMQSKKAASQTAPPIAYRPDAVRDLWQAVETKSSTVSLRASQASDGKLNAASHTQPVSQPPSDVSAPIVARP